MKAKDERQKLNNEVLSGIKGIKMQAWERSFQERLQALRDAELAVLWRYLLVKAVSGTIWSSTPLAVSLVTFGVYVMLGNTLEVRLRPRLTAPQQMCLRPNTPNIEASAVPVPVPQPAVVELCA